MDEASQRRSVVVPGCNPTGTPGENCNVFVCARETLQLYLGAKRVARDS